MVQIGPFNSNQRFLSIRPGLTYQILTPWNVSVVYADLRKVDSDADWYLHPNKRLLLCGSAKAPPRVPSQLTLIQLVHVIQGQALFEALY